MAEAYVGEVRLVGFNFAPYGWALCQGQLMPISQYETLFNLIGTTYGGDGQQTFALPNLQGRIPLHQGTGSSGTPYVIGQISGTETVTLNINQYPSHNHQAVVNSATSGGSTAPNNRTLCGGQTVYRNQAPDVAMNSAMLSSVGGSLPHENVQPFVALNWVISLYGVYPSQG